MRTLCALHVVRLAAAGFVVPTLVRAGWSRRRSASQLEVDDDTDPLDLGGSISVVVPARDEAARIAPLLAGLLGGDGGRYGGRDEKTSAITSAVAEVIVVDDGSVDATASVAEGCGATVLPAGSPPAGWLGKPWALEVGLGAATGEWVVFVDADVRVTPTLLHQLVRRAIAERAELLSAAGAFRLPPLAAWLHASMLATLVMRFGAPTGRASTTPASTLVNGQCLVARRRELIDAGGWGRVAGHLVEDVALARSIVARGGRVVFVDVGDGPNSMVVEPYDDLGGVWDGWGRSLGLPGVEPRWRTMLQALAVSGVSVLPLVRLVGRRFDILDVALLAMRAGLAAGLRRSYVDRSAATTLAVLASPLADVGAAVALAATTVRRRVRWRGRTVDVMPGRVTVH